MTTVIPPEARAYIDGIPPGHRPLFERLHRPILTAHPGAQVTLSYKTSACKAGNRRLYVGAWNRGDIGLRLAERPRRRLHLPPPRAGHQQGNPPAAGRRRGRHQRRGLPRPGAPLWPPDPNPAGVPAKARLPGHQREAWAAARQPSCLNAAALRPTGVSARIIARDAVDTAPLTVDMPTITMQVRRDCAPWRRRRTRRCVTSDLKLASRRGSAGWRP